MSQISDLGKIKELTGYGIGNIYKYDGIKEGNEKYEKLERWNGTENKGLYDVDTGNFHIIAKYYEPYLDVIKNVRKLPDVTVEMYVMCPSDVQWESNIRERELEGKFERYKADAAEIEFPNVAEGIDKIYEVVDHEIRLRMDVPRPEILEPAREELRKENEKLRLEDEERQRKKELLKSMEQRSFWHYCEVCGKKELLTAKAAFDEGWDYPPTIGHFGLLGPRTCRNCQLKDTLYGKINTSGKIPIVCEGDLTPEELVTWRRIKGEPESLLESLEEGV